MEIGGRDIIRGCKAGIAICYGKYACSVDITNSVELAFVVDCFRKMLRTGIAMGDPKIYMAPRLKERLLPHNDAVIIDGRRLEIVADPTIPVIEGEGGRWSSDVYIGQYEEEEGASLVCPD